MRRICDSSSSTAEPVGSLVAEAPSGCRAVEEAVSTTSVRIGYPTCVWSGGPAGADARKAAAVQLASDRWVFADCLADPASPAAPFSSPGSCEIVARLEPSGEVIADGKLTVAP
jgi:hypothetical protein